MGLFSIVKAEFWAIKHTLNLASTRGFEHVEVELDSQMAIHMLEHGTQPYHPCNALVMDILLGNITSDMFIEKQMLLRILCLSGECLYQ